MQSLGRVLANLASAGALGAGCTADEPCHFISPDTEEDASSEPSPLQVLICSIREDSYWQGKISKYEQCMMSEEEQILELEKLRPKFCGGGNAVGAWNELAGKLVQCSEHSLVRAGILEKYCEMLANS